MSPDEPTGAVRWRALRQWWFPGWTAFVVVETVALRLVYPVAIVFLEKAWAGSAVALAVCSVGLSAARGWTIDRLVRSIRGRLFDSVSRAIEHYPALAPAGAPPVEQLESELAKGLPWVEALLGVTLPSLVGNALALPLIALLAWSHVGALATLLAALAMSIGVAVSAVAARRLGKVGDAAWASYQPVARLIELGFRGRVELRVHRRGAAHRARLLSQVASWSKLERQTYVWGGLSGWWTPVATALVAALLALALGVNPLAVLRESMNHPSPQLVVAGLLALTVMPVLSALSRGLAEWSIERPHLQAIARFAHAEMTNAENANAENANAGSANAEPANVTIADADAANASLLGHEPVTSQSLGEIRAEAIQFRYPARSANEPGFLFVSDFVWGARESVALKGPNGCGKTTLTWLLLGALEPTQGEVRVTCGGESCSRAALAGRVAYLPQQPYFSDVETVREAIQFVAPNAAPDRVACLLEELFAAQVSIELPALLDRRVMSLSMGQRRVIAIARVLLRDAALVILDEPEANLDGEFRERVMAVLALAKTRSRLLIVTHDEAFARLADRVHLLS